jgi:hypothetical protein
MNLPTNVIFTGCDSMPLLQQALQAARRFQPMDSSRVAGLPAETQKPRWSCDATVHFVSRLGEVPERSWISLQAAIRVGVRGQNIGPIHIAYAYN